MRKGLPHSGFGFGGGLWLLVGVLFGMGCADDKPSWCVDEAAPVATCQGAHCVLAVVVDYKRLEPRGYRVFELSGAAVDRQQAEQIAHDHVVTDLKQPEPKQTDCVRADDFIHCALIYPDENRFLVIVSARTGTVLFAQQEVYADEDRGYDFPLPSGFSPPANACSSPVAEPSSRRLVVTGAPGLPGDTTPVTEPQQALEQVRQLALTASFLGDRTYSAMVISHAPARGEFDAASADWYVWLYREEP